MYHREVGHLNVGALCESEHVRPQPVMIPVLARTRDDRTSAKRGVGRASDREVAGLARPCDIQQNQRKVRVVAGAQGAGCKEQQAPTGSGQTEGVWQKLLTEEAASRARRQHTRERAGEILG